MRPSVALLGSVLALSCHTGAVAVPPTEPLDATAPAPRRLASSPKPATQGMDAPSPRSGRCPEGFRSDPPWGCGIISVPVGTTELSDELSKIDGDVKAAFGDESGLHRYNGLPKEILAAYKADGETVQRLVSSLDVVVDRSSPLTTMPRSSEEYEAASSAVLALARRASLRDFLYTTLSNTRYPEVKFWTPREEAALLEVDILAQTPAAIAHVMKLRDDAWAFWSDLRKREVEAPHKAMVIDYTLAVIGAIRLKVHHPWTARAAERLLSDPNWKTQDIEQILAANHVYDDEYVPARVLLEKAKQRL